MNESNPFQMVGLTLDLLRAVNTTRRDEWRERDGSAAWTGADWSNEMCGEAGETANVVKKLRRIETGYKGPGPTEEHLLEQLAEEVADMIICADLFGMVYGMYLATAVTLKFNKTSEKQNLATRLPDPSSEPRFTWETVPCGHAVPGSGTIVEKNRHTDQGWHITFRRDEEGFAKGQQWSTFHLGSDKVPTELTPTGLRYWR